MPESSLFSTAWAKNGKRETAGLMTASPLFWVMFCLSVRNIFIWICLDIWYKQPKHCKWHLIWNDNKTEVFTFQDGYNKNMNTYLRFSNVTNDHFQHTVLCWFWINLHLSERVTVSFIFDTFIQNQDKPKVNFLSLCFEFDPATDSIDSFTKKLANQEICLWIEQHIKLQVCPPPAPNDSAID